MLDCISVENMRRSDALTIEHYVPSLELMGRAAIGAPSMVTSLGSGWNADVYLIQVIDYAGNASTYRVFMNTEPSDAVEGVTIKPNENGSGFLLTFDEPQDMSGIYIGIKDVTINNVLSDLKTVK